MTREQVAALLFRYAQLQKLELAADQSVPDFSDTASVCRGLKRPWTGQCARACSAEKTAASWIPWVPPPRAEVIAILMRFSQSTVEAE